MSKVLGDVFLEVIADTSAFQFAVFSSRWNPFGVRRPGELSQLLLAFTAEGSV
ncbi:hypothetical protein [Streptomyces albireticuli]|uniref:hypothetical protein n=1 Tax=Streptomyces albireticuli TaxID=1940 RepID=UPI001475E774